MPYKVRFDNLAPTAQKEVECLAENIYFESALEPNDGKIAVAFVTLNRVDKGFANNICGVVKQKINNVCQFSWWCEEKPFSISNSKSLTNGGNILYNDIRNLATYVYLNKEIMRDPSKGALYYHADYVSPGWKNMKTTVKIGRHIFYIKV
jgi:spore germination cell wall hydrolase CwlJ-like protein